MNLKAKEIVQIFRLSIDNWHINECPLEYNFNDYLKNIIYQKNQIDTIQWHIEDEIRREDLSATDLLQLKRKIDKLNQERTDKVEILDKFIFELIYPKTKIDSKAKMNSETPAWLIDRMSILELKIYHMLEQTKRTDVDKNHIETCKQKLNILLEQRNDLCLCLDELNEELNNGTRYFKTYQQMKMYNNQSLNPSLYKKR